MRPWHCFLIYSLSYCYGIIGQPSDRYQCPEICDGRPAQGCVCYRDGFLDCENKNLTEVPKDLHTCGTHLELQENQITRLDVLDFMGLVNVTTLSMINNKLSKLTAGVFSQLTSVEEIHLDGNQINRIEDCTFQGLNKLRIILLPDNQIKTVTAGAFDGIPNLQRVSLFSNQLTNLNMRWFEGKPHFTQLLVANNLWNCTCELKRNYMMILNDFNQTVRCEESFPIFSSFCIRCRDSSVLRNQYLGNISYSEFSNCSPSEKVPEALLTVNDHINRQLAICQPKVEMLVQIALSPSTTENTMSVTTSTKTRVTIVSAREQQTLAQNTTTSSVTIGATSNSLSKQTTIDMELQQSSIPTWVIALIIVLAICLLIAGLLVVVLVIRRRKENDNSTELQDQGVIIDGNNFLNKSFTTDDNGAILPTTKSRT
ncbi:unnamed protein product [Clavelina lepadiformis]|uniref:Uncharacterized protein n=1 Tax=Clavelina lepadiformis TaxID=159417 RepID=A0ABP0H2R9_CLALP